MRVDFFEQKFTKTKKSESESEDFHLCFYETGVIGDASSLPVWALSIESWHWRRRWRCHCLSSQRRAHADEIAMGCAVECDVMDRL